MANGHVAGQTPEDALGKDLGNQSHIFMNRDLLAVGGDDTGAFLTAMLKGIEPKIGEFGRVFVAEDTANATLMEWSS